MKKWLIAVVLLLILAGLGLTFFLNSLIASAVERGGQAAMGVPTHVGSVDAGLFQGHLGFVDLAIDNPPGYSPAKFLRCERLVARWDNGSLWDSQLIVKEFTVRGMQIELERTDQGGNWSKLMQRERAPSEGGAPSPEAESGSSRSVVIERIVLEDIRVGLTLAEVSLLGGRKELKLPRLELKGLRSDGSLAQIAGVILDALVQATLEEVTRQGGDFLPKDVLKDLSGSLKAFKQELQQELDQGLQKLLGGNK